MDNNRVFIYEKLNDTSKFSKSVDEDGYMHLKGTFGVCNSRNRNNRVYTTENYGSMVKRLQERIKTDGGILGELEHPNTMTISMENASHVVCGIDIDESGVVTGEIKLLHTPKGKIAEEIVRGGLPLFISSRAQGTIDKNGVVTLEDLATYDIVSQPGFAQARLGLMEGLVQESLSDENVLVVAESIETNKENNNNEIMTQEEAKALLEKVDNLTKEVETLKEQLATNSKPDYRELAESIQNWCKDEFEPMIENWVKTEYSDMIQGWINEEYTKHTQEWITETLSPAIEKWVMKEYNENLKGWIANEYSDKVNEWLNTEFVGGIQSWINEEYSAQVEKWMTTEFKQHLMESIEEKINANITESRSSKLANIDDILNILESSEPLKPAYSSKHQDNINENKNDNNDEPLFIREMPAEVAPKWNMASAEVKESIKRRAKLYELTNEDQINRFWNNIVFESIKPATSVYEGLDNVKDDAERQVRMQLRRFRR